MIGHALVQALNVSANGLIIASFVIIWTWGSAAYRWVTTPKHFVCGSRWHVRRYAYYHDVPLYHCSRCEPMTSYTELNVFVATDDDGELLRDHLLADELELGRPLDVKDLWRHINYKPEVSA